VNGGAKAVGSESKTPESTSVPCTSRSFTQITEIIAATASEARDSDSLEYQDLKSSVSRKHSMTSFAVQEAVEIIIPERFYDAYDSHHRGNGRKLLRKAGWLNG
jgi:hypothetical protein